MAHCKPYERSSRHLLWRGIMADMTIDKTKPFADVAARVRWHRSLEGLDQKEYAERAGLKRSQLSNWESGAQCVSVDGARKLRRTYGLSMDFIFEGIDDALPMTLRAALRDNPLVK